MKKQESLEGKTILEITKMFPEDSWTAISTDKTLYANDKRMDIAMKKLKEKGYIGEPILIQTNSKNSFCYSAAA